MAELLIRLKDNTHSDSVKDRMCYKRGDIVVVKPDGHHWGRAEGLPDFAVIRTNRTEARMEQYLAVHEIAQAETTLLPLAEWTMMKARGDYGQLTAMPTEGAAKTRPVGPRQKRIVALSLTGPVLRPHTRRRWGLILCLLPLQKARDITTNGRAIIPFTQLRIALKDKTTGVQV